MRIAHTLMILVLSSPVVVIGQQPAPALQHIPDDAGLVILVRDMQRFAAGLSGFGQAIHDDRLADLDVDTLLGMLFDCQSAGLDPRGTFAFALAPGQLLPVLIGPVAEGASWPPAVAVGLPAQPFTIHLHGREWWTVSLGDVALVAPSPAALEGALDSSGRVARRIREDARRLGQAPNDVLVWADMPSWRPILRPLLQVAEGFMQFGMAVKSPQGQADSGLWRWFFEEARCFVDEALVYVAGFSADGTALRARDLVAMKPGGQFADYLGAVSRSARDPLRGLPAESAAVVFGGEWSLPSGLATCSEFMLDAMLSTPSGLRLLEDPAFAAGITAAKDVYRLVPGYNGMMRSARGGGMALSGIYLTDDPGTVMERMRTSIPVMVDARILRMMGADLSVDLEIDSARVGPARVEVFTFTFTSPDEELQRVVRAFYGKTTRFYMAAHPRGVAYAMAPDDEALDILTRLLDTDAPRLADDARLARARAALPPDPQLCVFADLPELVALGLGCVRAAGDAVPDLHFRADAAPYVAFGIYLEPDSLRSELYVPALAVRIVVDELREAAETPATVSLVP